jgi:hypothetical protein
MALCIGAGSERRILLRAVRSWGATFTIPLFALLFGLSQTEAQGMGLAVVLPAIVIAIPTYTLAGLQIGARA